MRFRSLFLLVQLLVLSFLQGIDAQITLPHLYSSNMVLPRNAEVAIQGKAFGETRLTLKIGTEQHFTRVDTSTGHFKFILSDLTVGPSFDISIYGLNDTLIFSNVVVGDLWLCAGQSNMQYTPEMLGLSEEGIDFMEGQDLRLLNVKVDTDYLPRNDISGGKWEVANAENIRNFSATAYFFGQYLSENLDVPIGLISSNLGATSIETWMSVDALKKFPQFDEITSEIEDIGRDYKTLYKEFKEYESEWNAEFYERGPGMLEEWWKVDLDDSDWLETEIPMFWEYLGEEDHDGSFWFRKQFNIDIEALNKDLILNLNQIDDYDITWVNGQEVGRSFGSRNFRSYQVPREILKEKDNQITIRVFDTGGLGGIYTNAFWGNQILNGSWKYKKGRKIDSSTFPKPVLPNGSIFSHPALLYNGSIAPLHQLPIAGVIWYQGEANEQRAVEYEGLLKALINDWRMKWSNDRLPFFIVQLANYRAEVSDPKISLWAEMRESQSKVSKMEQVDLVTAIDIGDADDIHPKNKKEVGRRLALLAMHYQYGYPLEKGPTYKSFEIGDDEIIVSFETYHAALRKVRESEEIRGFQIAGADGNFEWAEAEIISDNTVKIYSSNVSEPRFVRYAWSDNPGLLNLENSFGLPVFPFRTDEFELSTSDQVFQFDPHGF